MQGFMRALMVIAVLPVFGHATHFLQTGKDIAI